MPSPIVFPSNPSINETYVAPNGYEYIWDQEKWNCVTTANLSSAVIVTGSNTLRNVADVLADFNSGMNFGGPALAGEDDTPAVQQYYNYIPPGGTGFYPPGELNIASSLTGLGKEVLWSLQGTTAADGVSVPSLPGVVRTFVGHGEVVQRTMTTARDVAMSTFSRATSHTGGNAADTNATVLMSTAVNSGAADSNTSLAVSLANNGTGNNTGSQIVATLASSVASGSHTGLFVTAADTTGTAPTVQFTGARVQIMADGPDTNGQRGALNISLNTQTNPAGTVEAHHAIRIRSAGSASNRFDTGILFTNVSMNAGVDLSGATLGTGPAIRLAADQPISLSTDDAHQLRYTTNTGALEYRVSGSAVVSVPDSGAVALTRVLNMGGNAISNVAVPVNSSDVATKGYADSVSQGLAVKTPARLLATSNLNLASPPTAVDSVTLNQGDRILLIGQSTASANGIYVLSGGALVRAPDANSSALMQSGTYVLVTAGNTYSGTSWLLTTPNPINLGATALTFTQFTQSTQLVGGPGVTVSGATVSAVFGTTANTVAQGNDTRLVGALQASNNLSDVASSGTARANLGLGTLATQNSATVAITGGAINATTVGGTTPASGAFTNLSASSLSVSGTGAITIPTGTSAQQPVSPTVGMIRFNTTSNRLEYYNGLWTSPLNSTGDTMTGALAVPSLTVSGVSTFNGAVTANATLTVAGNLTTSSLFTANAISSATTVTAGVSQPNNWILSGAVNNASPTITAAGQDPNINATLLTKGNGGWFLRNGNGTLTSFLDGTGAGSSGVNYLSFSNAPDGSTISLNAVGTGATAARGISYNTSGGAPHSFNSAVSAPSVILTDGSNRTVPELVFNNVAAMTTFNFSGVGNYVVSISVRGYRSPGDRGAATYSYIPPSLSAASTGTSANIANGSYFIQVVSTSGIIRGMTASGPGIPANTYVVSVSSSVVQLSNPVTSPIAIATTLTFALAANNVLAYAATGGGYLLQQVTHGTISFEQIGVIGDYTPPSFIPTSAPTAQGNSTLNFASTTNIFAGMLAYGNGVPAGATVAGTTGTTVTLSTPVTSAVSTGSYIGFEAPATDNTDTFNVGTALLSAIGGATLVPTPGSGYLFAGGASGVANVVLPPRVKILGATPATTVATYGSLYTNYNEYLTNLRLKPGITINTNYFTRISNVLIMRQGLPVAPPDAPTYASFLNTWLTENGNGGAAQTIAITNLGASSLDNVQIVGFNTAVVSNGQFVDYRNVLFHTINGIDISGSPSQSPILENIRGRCFWSGNLTSTTLSLNVVTGCTVASSGHGYVVGDLLYDALGGFQTVTSVGANGAVTSVSGQSVVSCSYAALPVSVATRTLGKDYNNNNTIPGGAGSGCTLALTGSAQTVPVDFIPGTALSVRDGVDSVRVEGLYAKGYRTGLAISNASPLVQRVSVSGYGGYGLRSYGVWQWNTTLSPTNINNAVATGFDVNFNLAGVDPAYATINPVSGTANWTWITLQNIRALPSATNYGSSISIGSYSRGAIDGALVEAYGPLSTSPAVTVAANALSWKLDNVHPTNLPNTAWISVDPTSEPRVSLSHVRPVQFTTTSGGTGGLSPMPLAVANRDLWPRHVAFDSTTLTTGDGSPSQPLTVQSLTAGTGSNTHIALSRGTVVRSALTVGSINTSVSGVTIDTTTRYVVTAASVAAGGSGYAVNDVLRGPSLDTYLVTSVTGGAVTGVAIQSFGLFVSAPANPVSTTGGTGTGATLTLTLAQANSLTLNPSGFTYATTPTQGDNSTKVATTAFVAAAISAASISGTQTYVLPAATATSLGGVMVPSTSGLTITSGGSLGVAYGTTGNTAAVGNDVRIVGALQASSNLSDLTNPGVARGSLGLGAMATQGPGAVTITGGTINGTTIGATSAAAGTFTTLSLTGSQTQSYVLAAPSGGSGAPSFRQLLASDISGLGTIVSQNSGAISISGGTINGTTVGNTAPAPATVSSLSITGSIAQSSVFIGPSGGPGTGSWRQLSTADISGFGTMASQNASSVNITGGSIANTSLSLSSFVANGNSGTNRGVTAQTTGTNRWFVGADSSAESIVIQATSASSGSGSTALTFSNTNSLFVGMFVSGTNISANTTLISKTTTTVTLSNALTGTVASGASITFYANTGSNLTFTAYDDAGNSLGSQIYINRLGGVVLGTNTANGSSLAINAASGTTRTVSYQSGGLSRWLQGADASAETSSVTKATSTATGSGSSSLTFSSTSGITVGMFVFGQGIAAGATVTGITSTTVTMSIAAVGTVPNGVGITFSANVGSNYILQAVPDSGALGSTVTYLSVARNTGALSINSQLTTFGNPLYIGGSTVPVVFSGPRAEGAFQYYLAPNTGTNSVTVQAGVGSIMIDGPGTLASLTVNPPTSFLANNQILEIWPIVPITSFNFNASLVHGVTNIGALAAGGGIKLLYSTAVGSWYPLTGWGNGLGAPTPTPAPAPAPTPTPVPAPTPVPTPTPTPTTTLDPNNKGSGVALGSGNLSATLSSNTPQIARSTTTRTGKVYFEINLASAATNLNVGVCDGSFPLSGTQGGSTGDSVAFYPSELSPYSGIWCGNNTLASGNSSSVSGNGDIISVAVDIANRRVWFTSGAMRNAGYNWNFNSSANPGSGTGGLSFSSVASPCYACVELGASSGSSIGINFGAAGWTVAIPSGFSPWNTGT